MVREEPYLGLTWRWMRQRWRSVAIRASAGAAWLSSARAVRCWVKSRNERNPYRQLPAVRLGTLAELPVTNRRKVGMTSSHHGPYVQGYTRATMGGTERGEAARRERNAKAARSPD